MNKANLIKEITITENDGTETQMSIFKHENGGLFGIDISFLDSIDDELSLLTIPDVFNEGELVELYED
jgi:hypothetical protein